MLHFEFKCYLLKSLTFALRHEEHNEGIFLLILQPWNCNSGRWWLHRRTWSSNISWNPRPAAATLNCQTIDALHE